MDYGELFRRAWKIVWGSKALLVLGLLFALGAGSGSIRLPRLNRVGVGDLPSSDDLVTVDPDQSGAEPADEMPVLPIPSDVNVQALTLAVVGVLLALMCAAGILFLVFGLLSIMARGGIIAAVGEIEAGNSFGFRQALGVGWHRLWRLMIILSIPYIPVTLGAILVVWRFAVFFGGSGVDSLSELSAPFADPSFKGSVLVIMIPLSILSLILGFVQVFADRACVLESTGALESFRRGWRVLRPNLGSALVLLLLELALRLVLGLIFSWFGLSGALRLMSTNSLLAVVMLVLGVLLPIPLFVGMIVRAYLTTLWTLAWREWSASVKAPA